MTDRDAGAEAGEAAEDAFVEEAYKRDGGTSKEDVEAYGRVSGAAGAAAACTAYGGAAIAPLCAKVGGYLGEKIGGFIYDVGDAIFGGEDTDAIRKGQAARFDAYAKAATYAGEPGIWLQTAVGSISETFRQLGGWPPTADDVEAALAKEMEAHGGIFPDFPGHPDPCGYFSGSADADCMNGNGWRPAVREWLAEAIPWRKNLALATLALEARLIGQAGAAKAIREQGGSPPPLQLLTQTRGGPSPVVLRVGFVGLGSGAGAPPSVLKALVTGRIAP